MEKLAILMADLSGYTALTEIHGAATAAQIVDRYIQLAERSLTGESYMLERVGDLLLIVSPDVTDIAFTITKLHEYARSEHHFLPVHAGIHYGEVLTINGHLFGSAINLTSRITSRATQGTILCSGEFVSEVKSELTTERFFNFKYLDGIRFKNIHDTVPVFELITEEPASTNIDPVCRMQLDKTETSFSNFRNGKLHYFCSLRCQERFVASGQEIWMRSNQNKRITLHSTMAGIR